MIMPGQERRVAHQSPDKISTGSGTSQSATQASHILPLHTGSESPPSFSGSGGGARNMKKQVILKPLVVTEKEVGDIAWSRIVQKHKKPFILLCVLMVAISIAWLLPTKLNEILHTCLYIIALISWLCAMYLYFFPKYQKAKKELLDEWNK